jgi:hypothetical protein
MRVLAYVDLFKGLDCLGRWRVFGGPFGVALAPALKETEGSSTGLSVGHRRSHFIGVNGKRGPFRLAGSPFTTPHLDSPALSLHLTTLHHNTRQLVGLNLNRGQCFPVIRALGAQRLRRRAGAGPQARRATPPCACAGLGLGSLKRSLGRLSANRPPHRSRLPSGPAGPLTPP